MIDYALPRKEYRIYIICEITEKAEIANRIAMSFGVPHRFNEEPIVIFGSYKSEFDFNLARKSIEKDIRLKENIPLNVPGLNVVIDFETIRQVYWERTDRTELFNEEWKCR